MANKQFDGGRCLRATFINRNLSTSERLVLVTFAGDLNFKSNFQEKRYITLHRWSLYTGISQRNLYRIIKSLEERGYLKIYRESGKVNYYSLTQKLFDEYAKFSDFINDETPDTMSPVDEPTPDTVSPPTPDTMSPVDQLTPDAMSPPVSILNNSLNEYIAPSECVSSRAGTRAYDPTHTHDVPDVDLPRDKFIKRYCSRHFRNILPSIDGKSIDRLNRDQMETAFSYLVDKYPRDVVISGIKAARKIACGDLLWFDMPAVDEFLANREWENYPTSSDTS